MKTFIIAVLLLALTGCERIYVKHEIWDDHDYEKCIKEYTIHTAIFVRNWYGFPKDCAYTEYKFHVKQEDKDRIAAEEYQKAVAFKKRIEDCFGEDL